MMFIFIFIVRSYFSDCIILNVFYRTENAYVNGALKRLFIFILKSLSNH